MILLSLGIMLGLALIMGEIAQKLHQPAVLGEILTGLILGPTVLDAHKIALESISSLSVVLFLLVAGLEVDLSTVLKQGKTGFSVAITGMVIPFSLGLAAAYYFPQIFGLPEEQNTMVFSLFLATAMSISALPVIAKTLMDMNLYNTDFGMITIGAAIFNDLLGWVIFSLILSMAGGTLHGGSIWLTVAGTLIFTGVMLTAGKYLINRSIPLLQAYTRWPGGVLSFSITIALLGAAFTEWIGIHAIFRFIYRRGCTGKFS
ncbi:hypothetical protein CHS0354_001947 [Potamilus streckersoni]|uniref:Cation/H+ exchanger transmembrane domain-containing protein n=1 Tax=Potamilus streckersoni TaxID=2493646 RepID=A0AAE0W8I0_9BIVA|nr:hypothetical protein CHS0354_001947 [Potamilus streckersoni]